MFITVASFKGGVGKTTTAIHVAAYMQLKAPTLLIDGDPNRSATGWTKRGELPFKVVDERQGPRYSREFEHIIVDTAARPQEDDLKAFADGCDLLIIPTTPDAMAIDALIQTVDVLEKIGSSQYRILLTIIPPRPSHDGEEARALMGERGLPLFRGEIPRLVAFQKASLQGRPVSRINDPRRSRLEGLSRRGEGNRLVPKNKFSAIFEARKAITDEQEQQKRGRGRPRGYAGGKRDNKEEYTQASAYIRRDIHKRVKSVLALEDKEYSELVEELLAEWLDSRK